VIRTSRILAASSLVAIVAAAVACSSSSSTSRATEPTLKPALRVVGGVHAQIAAAGVIGVSGLYVGCEGQSNDEEWVLDTPGNAGVLEASQSASAPSVRLGDDNCVLQIETVWTSASTSYFSTESPISLQFGPHDPTSPYPASSVAFDDQDESLAFYANAQSSVTDSSGDFTVTLMISADPNETSTSTAALAQGPQTCADILAGDPEATDGTYTLDVGGNPTMPWTVYCLGMQSTDGGAPLEYLPLVTGSNYSQLPQGGLAEGGAPVFTSYTKVRIDPIALVIHGGDQTFSSSSGTLTDDSDSVTVTSMPYGAAMTCGTSEGIASINLTSTGFSIPAGAFFDSPGASGSANYLSDTSVSIVVTGSGSGCRWIDGEQPGPTPENNADITFSVVYSGEDAGGG
jgi:hypothetical protein